MTIGDMKVGSMLQLGKYGISNDDPKPIIWLKATPNSDFITLNTVDYLCFDAREPSGTEWRYVGNPNYKLSNIHNFLNSDDEDWFAQTHPADEPPSRMFVSKRQFAYDRHFGFLYHFEEFELESIKPETFEVDGELITSKMRLPSLENITGVNHFKVFSKKGIRPHATEDMLYTRVFTYESYIPFWLNDRLHGGFVAVMGRKGTLERQFASDCSGLRPVCTIKQDTPVLKQDGVYYIEPRAIQYCTDGELFALLGIA